MANLRELCKDILIMVKDGAKQKPLWDAKVAWTITLSYQGRRMTIPYYSGGNTDTPIVWEVLGNLLSDAQVEECDSYWEWCSDCCLTPNEQSYKMFQACRRMAKRLRRFLGDAYETFFYADRND